MQKQTERVTSPGIDHFTGPGSGTDASFPAGVIAEVVSIDGKTEDRYDQPLGGAQLHHAMSLGVNLESSTVDGNPADAVESEITIDPPAHSHVEPTIHLEDQSYPCSWRPQGSDVQCNYVAPNRSALLRHLGATHQVSGAPNTPIICHLTDSTMGSACEAQIKRRNFPRHVDTHYPVRYHCPYCPADTSFSRKDSWKKHVKDKHA